MQSVQLCIAERKETRVKRILLIVAAAAAAAVCTLARAALH